MNKRALMLTAATVALLSGQSSNPALAATTCDSTTATTCNITTTVVVTPMVTSTVLSGAPGNIDITSPGGIAVGTANATLSTAALLIDSDNVVTNTSATISNNNTIDAIGVEIHAGHGSSTTTVGTYDGLLDTITTIGSRTGKTGLLVDLPTGAASGILDTTGTLGGLSVSTITVTGDNSYGIHILSGVTLKGPLLINGTVAVTSSTTAAGSSTGVIGVEVDGNMIGNLEVNNSGLGGSIVATGAGSDGLVVLGNIAGNIYNGGNIEALGMASPTASTGNPQGNIAFLLENSVTQGIYNAGPATSGDVTAGVAQAGIFTQGTGPALIITPAASGGVPITIGVYTSDGATQDATDPGYSFYNRGVISAQPDNIDTGSAAMRVVGGLGTPVTFSGLGILNSGSISSTSSTDGAGSNIASTALFIGDYVTVPKLVNSNEVGTGRGNISASVSGASPGQAVAIWIDGTAGCATGCGSLTEIDNSGTISATAASSDLTITGALTATAINDLSGSLTKIVNSGTISASTSILNLNQQSATAVNAANNTAGLDFIDSGTVVGNIFFGIGNDTLTLTGTGALVSSSDANNHPAIIDFHGGHDTLSIGDSDNLYGSVLERGGGYVDLTVGSTGLSTAAIYINNTNFASPTSTSTNYDNGTLEVGQMDVKNGATFGLSLSQGFNQAANVLNPVLVSADNNPGNLGTIHLESGSHLAVTFGSFVSTPGTEAAKFVLFDAPSGRLLIDNPTSIQTSIEGTIPFLFSGDVCGYNLAVFTACSGTAPADSQLVLNLTPKTVGTGANQVPLTGYAAQMFPLANSALANDNELGAAVIEAGSGLDSGNSTDVATGNKLYQNIYSQFAPEVTGASRALVVALTDQATSVVGARQRVLRMYAGQNAAATLWGQEFTQRFDNNTNLPNGYRDSGFGFALGMDGGSPSSGRFGGAFTFFSGDILEKEPAQVKTSTSWYMLSGYSNWRGQGLFVDSNLTLGYGSLNGNRSIIIDNSAGTPIFERNASNKRASILASGGITGGAILTMGTLVLEPQGSLDLMTLRENGYTESCTTGCSTTGGDGFDLRVDPYYAKSLRGYLGASAREDLNLGSFFLQPEARVGYRYDFLADPVNLKAMFAADPNATQFTLTGPDPAKGSFVAGAGIAATTGSWSIGVNYDYLSGSGSSLQTGTLTLVGRI